MTKFLYVFVPFDSENFKIYYLPRLNTQMRKIILGMQITIDGYIEGPNGELDWAIKEDEEVWDDLFELHRSVDTLMFGRVMYPDYEKFWLDTLANPTSHTKNEIKYAKIVDKMQKIVFSTTLTKVDWKTTNILKKVILNDILQMKQQPGNDMIIVGGAKLVSSFLNLGLIDEIHLVLNPLIIGGGKALFKDVKEKMNLKLINVKSFKSGKVLLHYGKIT